MQIRFWTPRAETTQTLLVFGSQWGVFCDVVDLELIRKVPCRQEGILLVLSFRGLDTPAAIKPIPAANPSWQNHGKLILLQLQRGW
ncbi:hypothetical protein OAG76_05295 [Rubripirellula sp.]|nr:hypothetical protein [Rubripirellula sp.]